MPTTEVKEQSHKLACWTESRRVITASSSWAIRVTTSGSLFCSLRGVPCGAQPRLPGFPAGLVSHSSSFRRCPCFMKASYTYSINIAYHEFHSLSIRPFSSFFRSSYFFGSSRHVLFTEPAKSLEKGKKQTSNGMSATRESRIALAQSFSCWAQWR